MHIRLLLSLALGLTCGSAAFAQLANNEVRDQTPRETNLPVRNSQVFNPPGVIPSFSDIMKNVHGSYGVSYMGPRFEGSSDETYNIYLPDVSSVQLYHTAQLGFQVSPDLQIGINEAVVQNMADGVHGLTGNIYNRSFEWYDPNIYFNLPHLFLVPGWWVFTSASFSLPLNQASQDQKKITEFIIQQSWTVRTAPSPWTYGFHLYLNPQFYADPPPENSIIGEPPLSRQTLSFSFGHNLTYRVSPLFSVATATNFYVEHRSPDSQGFLHLGEGLPDYVQLSAKVFPNVYPLSLSFGTYLQALVFAPAWATTIIGGSINIGF